MDFKKDYYSILKVECSASKLEIKKSYKKLCLKYHPDRRGDEIIMKDINEAYEVLSSPEKRRVYDLHYTKNHEREREERQR
ncbi:DnaJ domain-containing protein, partial [Pasteurellaceae bacterium HPA106]|uniref:DnaJ domain-containing protein n=1 Tax=Spirabiliibacterium pneumoniae TaxID=221400 RepID=UPI001AAC6E30